MSGMWSGEDGIVAIYRRSLKPKDLWWNDWVSRPPAAVLVYFLRYGRLTPNQITFCSMFVSLLTGAVLLLWRGYAGLLVAAVLLQFAFILDCVDGQLARIRGTASVVGGHLDFLMDEIKAVTLVAAVAGRLAWQSLDGMRSSPLLAMLLGDIGTVYWLSVGMAGVVVVATGISLTTFMRRPEYLQATGAGGASPGSGGADGALVPARRSPLGRVIALCEAAGKAVLHYPQWFWIPALFDRIDLFLLPYLAAHALYLGRAGLTVLWRLGR